MKEANIISILNAFKSLPKPIFESYLAYFSIKIRYSELNDLMILFNHLKSMTQNIDLFDKYFIGYSIPQIGKEFDLLRFDSDTIVNIELKSSSEATKIKNQLIRNKYYLSFLNKETFLFTYVSSSKKLYKLEDDNSITEVNIRKLIEKLSSQSSLQLKNINDFFNPSNYLVSPFNSTTKFIKGKYFLTIHQEKIKKGVLSAINTSGTSILSIKGKAGTGKTLLTYDIVKELYNSKNVLIIHCGILNDGHYTLRDKFAWNILSAKSVLGLDYTEYDLIIVDEAQRIRKYQLKHFIEKIKANSKNCIFSYDAVQTLNNKEINANTSSTIEQNLTLPPFELTTKIRTNKEVARFIKCLFNTNEIIHRLNYSNIEIRYFGNHDNAIPYLKQLKSENWKIINYTPDNHRNLLYEKNNLGTESDNAHTVVGQEFDNVIAVIDDYFYYKNGELSTKIYSDKPFYLPKKMLFQIVSRTRLKLGIIIINNPIILTRCLKIFEKNTST